MRKKQTSLDSYSNGPKSLPITVEHDGNSGHVQYDSFDQASSTGHAAGHHNSSDTSANSNKFENISDNGSEISDEGYRSLGVIQSNAQKRESIHSQASIDDAENNGECEWKS